MLLYVLIFVLSAVLLLCYWSTSNYWKKRNIRQVNGTLLKFAFGDRSLAEHFKEIYDSNDEHVGVFIGAKPALLLKELEDIQSVLANDFQSFYSRGIEMHPEDTLADNVIFIQDFKRWKCIRQKITPVFTSAKLKNMFYILDKCARDFVELINVNEDLRKKTFHTLSIYTTATLGAAVFGIDTKLKTTMDSPFIEMTQKTLAPSFITNMFFVFVSYFPGFLKMLNLKFFAEHEDFFIGAVKQVLDSRRNEPNKKHDFIDMCIELQKQGLMRDPSTGYELEPTDEIMAAQAFFFFLAGSDTSATTMNFVLLELASNPKILKRLHDEIDNVFGDGVQELSYNDVEKLHYMDMVISEAMRKFPAVGYIQRQCTKTTVLPASKVKMEKDIVAVIPVFAIHRDERYYPNPEVFDPERFAPENLSNVKKFSFLPFGEGNRICIGARFARLQLKAGLAWLLRSFTLTPQNYRPKKFEQSNFSLRDTKTTYELIPRTK